MIDLRASKNVSPYYPEAVRARDFVEAFLWFTKVTLGVSEDRIAFLTSICSDDLNIVELPKTGMVGPFIQGGLDGYPFAGKTGVGAFSHHLPEHGVAMMFFGPHVGITDDGQVGKVVRPGQSAPSDCCGAAAAALRKLEAGGITFKYPRDYAIDDYQQETLEQLVLKHQDDILGAGPAGDARRFIRMSERLYQEEKQAFLGLLATAHFEAPAFVFGGILINEDGGNGSRIAFRDAVRVDHGRFTDLTKEFAEKSEAKFKEIQEGKTDVFR